MSNNTKCQMIKSSSELSLSSSDSYQSLSDLTIECCICLEEVENQNSYMPDCFHSWCKECNENLNNNHINNCPICKKPFNSVLTKGRWKFTNDYLGGKDKLFGFFVGQVMKLSQGKANPGIVNNLLKEKLK